MNSNINKKLSHIKLSIKEKSCQLFQFLFRNRIWYDFEIQHLVKMQKKKINLIWYKSDNVGDCLSPVVLKWMLNQQGLSLESKTVHFFSKISCVGSVINLYKCNQCIWGSGYIKEYKASKWQKHLYKYDVRAVRGPKTLATLNNNFKIKNQNIVFGDPGVLMPLIYQPKSKEKKYEVSLIQHHLEELNTSNKFHHIFTRTKDYKLFIDEIVASKLIVSSSLHGIILAEAYGVPAIWLRGKEDEYKYLDYYHSTNRFDVKSIDSLDQISNFEFMPLPNLIEMQKNLINSFP